MSNIIGLFVAIIVIILIVVLSLWALRGNDDCEQCPTVHYNELTYDRKDITVKRTNSNICGVVSDCSNYRQFTSKSIGKSIGKSKGKSKHKSKGKSKGSDKGVGYSRNATCVCGGPGYIYRYQDGKLVPIVQVPLEFELNKIRLLSSTSEIYGPYGGRLPIIYAKERRNGLYSWNGSVDKSTFNQGGWVNLAPGKFRYNYPGIAIPTDFTLTDYAITSKNIYALYNGITMGPSGPLSEVNILTKVATSLSDKISDNEVMMTSTSGGKLISAHTSSEFKLDGYDGIPYGILLKPSDSTLSGSKHVRKALTGLTSLDATEIGLNLQETLLLSGTDIYGLSSMGLSKLEIEGTNAQIIGSNIATAMVDGNGDSNYIDFSQTGSRNNIDPIFLDSFMSKSCRNRSRILDYHLATCNDTDNTLSVIIVAEEYNRKASAVHLYWKQNCYEDQVIRIVDNFTAETQVALYDNNLYIYHPRSCQG